MINSICLKIYYHLHLDYSDLLNDPSKMVTTVEDVIGMVQIRNLSQSYTVQMKANDQAQVELKLKQITISVDPEDVVF